MSIGRNILLSVIEKTCSSSWAFSVVLSLLDSTVFVGDADDMLTPMLRNESSLLVSTN